MANHKMLQIKQGCSGVSDDHRALTHNGTMRWTLNDKKDSGREGEWAVYSAGGGHLE
jgi:hypothetical protein